MALVLGALAQDILLGAEVEAMVIDGALAATGTNLGNFFQGGGMILDGFTTREDQEPPPTTPPPNDADAESDAFGITAEFVVGAGLLLAFFA